MILRERTSISIGNRITRRNSFLERSLSHPGHSHLIRQMFEFKRRLGCDILRSLSEIASQIVVGASLLCSWGEKMQQFQHSEDLPPFALRGFGFPRATSPASRFVRTTVQKGRACPPEYSKHYGELQSRRLRDMDRVTCLLWRWLDSGLHMPMQIVEEGDAPLVVIS